MTRPRQIVARIGKWLAGIFIVGSFVFWAWAFSPLARSENPARLENREFAALAEQLCALNREAMSEIPTPREANSHAERADQVAMGTGLVEVLVADLGALADTKLVEETSEGEVSSGEAPIDEDGPSDMELVQAWLQDWETYVGDRHRHTARLQEATEDTPDNEIRFLLLDMTEGSTYTERMDGFARLNDMDACRVPGDV